ncbi:MAG: hypothetical protein LBS68_00820 [Puniceicoccales bacterium]|jgi:hypothetical protein|nr:hypothetical protein [Puniceicoccales bacterium]
MSNPTFATASGEAGKAFPITESKSEGRPAYSFLGSANGYPTFSCNTQDFDKVVAYIRKNNFSGNSKKKFCVVDAANGGNFKCFNTSAPPEGVFGKVVGTLSSVCMGAAFVLLGSLAANGVTAVLPAAVAAVVPVEVFILLLLLIIGVAAYAIYYYCT